MARPIQSTLSNFFKTKRYYQTFTFYVPAPPKRSSGYREKELDKYLSHLLNDFTLESITTEAHQGTSQGMWVIVVLSSDDPDKKISANFPESVQETVPGIELILEEP